MSILDNLKSQESDDPPIILLYGVDGIGKSTLAAEFPDAVYLRTKGERVPKGVNIPGMEITSFIKMEDTLDALLKDDHKFKWVIIDSLDGFEPLVWDETCYRINKKSIEELGYGKGYVEADEEWGAFSDLVFELQAAGIGVLILAHPAIERFESPMSEPYNRFTIKIHKRANAIMRERADIVAFMNWKVQMKSTEERGGRKASHAEGKEREILVTGSPSFDAKNRYAMPNSITYRLGDGYKKLSEHFPPAKGVR
jgi:hypothetical protein